MNTMTASEPSTSAKQRQSITAKAENPGANQRNRQEILKPVNVDLNGPRFDQSPENLGSTPSRSQLRHNYSPRKSFPQTLLPNRSSTNSLPPRPPLPNFTGSRFFISDPFHASVSNAGPKSVDNISVYPNDKGQGGSYSHFPSQPTLSTQNSYLSPRMHLQPSLSQSPCFPYTPPSTYFRPSTYSTPNYLQWPSVTASSSSVYQKSSATPSLASNSSTNSPMPVTPLDYTYHSTPNYLRLPSSTASSSVYQKPSTVASFNHSTNSPMPTTPRDYTYHSPTNHLRWPSSTATSSSVYQKQSATASFASNSSTNSVMPATSRDFFNSSETLSGPYSGIANIIDSVGGNQPYPLPEILPREDSTTRKSANDLRYPIPPQNALTHPPGSWISSDGRRHQILPHEAHFPPALTPYYPDINESYYTSQYSPPQAYCPPEAIQSHFNQGQPGLRYDLACQESNPFVSQPVYHSEGTVVSQDNDDLNGTSKKPVSICASFLENPLRQIYLYLLLGLPALYFSRMTKIFKDADMTMSEIKQMALEMPTLIEGKNQNARFLMPSGFEPSTPPARYENLKYNWESLIDSLMREWKSFNIISVLLLSSILAMLQIQSAANNLLTRFSALLSLICALTSLLYGCLYMVKFSSMRKTHKAAEWAFEIQKGKTSIFWNVWVLLAMPLVWLTWSILLYIVCIFSFVWQTGTTVGNQLAPTIRSRDLLGPRVTMSAIFGLGVVYFIFIVITFRRYGDAMDEAWNIRAKNWSWQKAVQADQVAREYQLASHPGHPEV